MATNFWDDAKGVLALVAPTLGLALGGPLGGMAGKLIAQTLLGNEQASEAEIKTALASMTPEQAVALKAAEQTFQQQMKALDVDLARVEAGDRDSARKRQIETRDHAPEALGLVIIAGFFVVVYQVLFGDFGNLKDPAVSAIVGSVIGYVSAKADQVVGYYFGSSSSAKRKDDTLANLAAK